MYVVLKFRSPLWALMFVDIVLRWRQWGPIQMEGMSYAGRLREPCDHVVV